MSEFERAMNRLALYAHLPLALAALGLWMAPWLAPIGLALDLHQMAIAYAGVGAAILAGAGLGAALRGGAGGMFGLIVISAMIWAAIWQGGVLRFAFGAAWRYALLIAAFFYLDLRAQVSLKAGGAPFWAAPLRRRATFWTCALLAAIGLRLGLLGYY